MTTLPQPAYVMSEPHLSGYRVILGYETMTEAQDAQQVLTTHPARDLGLMQENDAVRALEWIVSVIDAAGLLNLSCGVQLGPTVWLVKATKAPDTPAGGEALLSSNTGEGE